MEIQFKKINSTFASINTLTSDNIGLEFVSIDDLNSLENTINNNNNDVIIGTNDDFFNSYIKDIENYDKLYNSEKEIYFLCFLETKLDKTTKRGAVLKSVSIGTTKLINLYNLRPIAKFLLDEIFKIYTFNVNENEKQSLIKSHIESTYSSVNEIDLNKYNKI